MDIVVIYEGEDACSRCQGWKRIDDGIEGGSWKYWAELPASVALAVQMRIVKPIECPRCEGTGIEPKKGSYQFAKYHCHVRSAIYRTSKPDVKYWKNHTIPLDEQVPAEDQAANDWMEYDPRDSDETSLSAFND